MAILENLLRIDFRNEFFTCTSANEVDILKNCFKNGLGIGLGNGLGKALGKASGNGLEIREWLSKWLREMP